MVPGRAAPVWSFEHAPRVRVRLAAATLLRNLWPPALFRRIQMEAPVRCGRLALYVLLALLVFHLGAWASGAMGALMGFVVEPRITAPPTGPWLAPPGAAIGPVGAWRPAVGVGQRAYSGMLPLELPLSDQLTLWAGASAAYLVWPYTAEAAYRAVGPDVWFSARWWTHGLVVIWWHPAVWTLFTPLMLLLLWQTREHRRIRHAHLWRAWAYGLVPASVLSGLLVVLSEVMRHFAVFTGVLWFVDASSSVVWAHACIVGVHHGVFWWAFVARYLRLPHALPVVVLTLIASLLVCALVLFLLSDWLGPPLGVHWLMLRS
jgi:hypothetical protein